MKNLFFILFLTFFSFNVFAQSVTFGVKGGVNFTNISGNNADFSAKPINNLITSFSAGGFVDFKLKSWSIQPGIYFTGKGSEGKADFITPGGTQKTDTKGHLYYIQVPVYALYHLPVVVGNIFFGAGPYAAVGVSGKLKGSFSTNSGQAGDFEKDVKFGNSSDSDYKSTDFGASFLAGIRLKNGILFSANYDLGLSNTSNSGTQIKSHNRVFGLSVGYAF